MMSVDDQGQPPKDGRTTGEGVGTSLLSPIGWILLAAVAAIAGAMGAAIALAVTSAAVGVAHDFVVQWFPGIEAPGELGRFSGYVAVLIGAPAGAGLFVGSARKGSRRGRVFAILAIVVATVYLWWTRGGIQGAVALWYAVAGCIVALLGAALASGWLSEQIDEHGPLEGAARVLIVVYLVAGAAYYFVLRPQPDVTHELRCSRLGKASQQPLVMIIALWPKFALDGSNGYIECGGTAPVSDSGATPVGEPLRRKEALAFRVED